MKRTMMPIGEDADLRVYGEVVITVSQDRQGFVTATFEDRGGLDFEDDQLDLMADEVLTAFERWRRRNSRSTRSA